MNLLGLFLLYLKSKTNSANKKPKQTCCIDPEFKNNKSHWIRKGSIKIHSIKCLKQKSNVFDKIRRHRQWEQIEGIKRQRISQNHSTMCWEEGLKGAGMSSCGSGGGSMCWPQQMRRGCSLPSCGQAAPLRGKLEKGVRTRFFSRHVVICGSGSGCDFFNWFDWTAPVQTAPSR